VPRSREKLSDAEVVRSILAGDTKAFGKLVDRHLAGVHAVVTRIVCNSTDAEDVTQDTFIRCLERLEQYDPSYSFRNWLLKIATNTAINCHRSRKRDKELTIRLADYDVNGSKQKDDNIELPSPREWQYWLGRLDTNQRAAIVLFHFHQMPYTQIAEALEVPLNTVRTLLHRGRKRLRELMAKCIDREMGPWNATIQNG